MSSFAGLICLGNTEGEEAMDVRFFGGEEIRWEGYRMVWFVLVSVSVL